MTPSGSKTTLGAPRRRFSHYTVVSGAALFLRHSNVTNLLALFPGWSIQHNVTKLVAWLLLEEGEAAFGSAPEAGGTEAAGLRTSGTAALEGEGTVAGCAAATGVNVQRPLQEEMSSRQREEERPHAGRMTEEERLLVAIQQQWP